MTELISERYEVESTVGVGGMSRVYRARDTSLERTVALKVLHEQFAQDTDYVERFRREARAVAQLSHPGIVTIIDRGEHEGKPFIVFEFVDGDNLHEVLARRGALSIREVLELGGEIARALAFAHAQGLVHRDVKPQNVILNREGRAKVTDFGIARSIEVEHGVTQTGTVMGTSAYLSPEQARGEQVDAYSDIYSLGAVLFELLTGRPPFEGESFVAVALQHVNQPAPSILERRPDCPVRLARAVERALAKDRSERFPTMDAFAAELEACLAQLGTEPELDATVIQPSPFVRNGRPHVARPRRRRIPLLVAVVVLLLALAGAAAFLLLRRHHSATPPTRAVATATRVPLAGVGALDPYGPGNREHPETASRATDGNPTTYWETETYRDGLLKPGVGLVVQSRQPVALRSLTITTTTPGFTAEIRTATSADGVAKPGPTDSARQTVGATATFPLRGERSSYWVVWITSLGSNSHVHITEVRAAS